MDLFLFASPLALFATAVVIGFGLVTGGVIAWYGSPAAVDAFVWTRDGLRRRWRAQLLALRAWADRDRIPQAYEVWIRPRVHYNDPTHGGFRGSAAFVKALVQLPAIEESESMGVEVTFGEPWHEGQSPERLHTLTLDRWWAMVRETRAYRDGTWNEEWWS